MRDNLRMPYCRSEERLFAVPLRCWPLPPLVICFEGFRGELIGALREFISQLYVVFVACDGSPKGEVSAVGFYPLQANATLAVDERGLLLSCKGKAGYSGSRGRFLTWDCELHLSCCIRLFLLH